VNDRDILDHPLEIGATSSALSGVVLMFSDRHSELSGALTTSSGAPASEFLVIVYPVDRAYWRSNARRVKTTRPSSDGAFSFIDLPGGEYLVAALTDAEPNEWQNPSFLEQLVASSVKVTVADGQRVRQDLRLVR